MKIIFFWNMWKGVASLESLRSLGLHIWFGRGSGFVCFLFFPIFMHFLDHCGSGVVRARFGFAAFSQNITFQPISSKGFPPMTASTSRTPGLLHFAHFERLHLQFFRILAPEAPFANGILKNMCFATVYVRNHCKGRILGTTALKHMFDCAATLLL